MSVETLNPQENPKDQTEIKKMKGFLGEDWKIERILTGTDKEKEIDILVRYDLSGNRVDSILYEPT